MKLNQFVALLLGCALASVAVPTFAKLPAPAPLTDEQKAKAAEVKEKAAEAAKKDAADLARYQDRAASRFFADAKAAGKTVPASTWVPPTPVAAVAALPAPSAPQGQKPPAAAKKTVADVKPAATKS